MLKFELMPSQIPKFPDLQDPVNQPPKPCLFWRVSIAEGPCEGWFLDQNYRNVITDEDPSTPDVLADTHETRWTRTPKGSDIRFLNRPGTVDFVNAWNLSTQSGSGTRVPYFYQPYYENGWVQIPAIFFLGEDGEPEIMDRYCYCENGNCAADGRYFIQLP